MEEKKILSGDTEDMVNHPKHYKTKKGLEAIQVIEAFTEDLTGIEATDTGNVIKYICRWKSKNGIEDLKKARWYLNHLIRHVEKTNKKADSFKEKTLNVVRLHFDSNEKASQAIDAMHDIMFNYGLVTLNDAYDLVGNNQGSYEDHMIGWTALPELKVDYDSSNETYYVELPKPIPLN